ncbi:30S ribosomal protein S15 [soil metagenome]
MYLTKEKKVELFENHGRLKSKTDTGSPESQIALFSHRINHLTEHLKQNPKDFSTRLGLLKLVGKRRRLLDYLYKREIERYRAILAELNLRK